MAVLMIDAMFSTLWLSNPNSRQVAPAYQLDGLCKGTLQFIVPPRLCRFQACIFRSVVGTHAGSPSIALDIVGVRGDRMGVFLNLLLFLTA
jgi:hypothetical protein